MMAVPSQTPLTNLTNILYSLCLPPKWIMQSPLILLAGFSIDVSQNPERNPECVWVMRDEIAGFIRSEEVGMRNGDAESHFG